MQTTYRFDETAGIGVTLIKTETAATLSGATTHTPILHISATEGSATVLHGPNTNLIVNLTSIGVPTAIATAIDLLPLLPKDTTLDDYLFELAYSNEIPIANMPIVGGTTTVYLTKQKYYCGWGWAYVLRGAMYDEAGWSALMSAMSLNMHDTYGRDTEGSLLVAARLADIMSWKYSVERISTVCNKGITLRRTRENGNTVIDEIIGEIGSSYSFAPYLKMRVSDKNPPYIEELVSVSTSDPEAWATGIQVIYNKARL